MKIDKDSVLVFDLDDTLYKEIDFVKSAYREIARVAEIQIGQNIYDEMFFLFTEKQQVFDILLAKYPIKLTMQDLIDIYRYHFPSIAPVKEIETFINKYKANNSFALITDGRSVTQRNKLKALGLLELFEKHLFISQEVGFDKTVAYSFRAITNAFPTSNFFYFADNPKKDFIIANKLGWKTFQIQDPENIHDSFAAVPPEYEAKNKITYNFLDTSL
jgi:putative hydrolase of the HAD superfamily